MIAFPVTTLYAALLLVVAIGIIMWVVGGRREEKIGLGDGGNENLIRRMRSQANFTETAPMLIIALGLMEANGLPAWALHLFGIVLVAGRAAHPFGMSNKWPNLPLRSGSTQSTLALFVVGAVVLLGQLVLG